MEYRKKGFFRCTQKKIFSIKKKPESFLWEDSSYVCFDYKVS